MQDMEGYTDEGPRSTVEVVSDQEYFEYEQQFKTAQSGGLIDEDEQDVIKEDNPAVKFVLRVIDAIFFVGEKFFLVSYNVRAVASSAIKRKMFDANIIHY